MCGEQGCPELADGSNCGICGDYICDTPADPKILHVDPTTCLWDGTTCSGSPVDANGDPYNPPVHNIMAYVPPQCMQHFTPGQGHWMRVAIINAIINNIIQNILVPNNLVLSNLTVQSGQHYIYDIVETITAQNITVEAGGILDLRTGIQIKMLPPSRSKVGSYFTARIDTLCSAIYPWNSAKLAGSDNENSIHKGSLTSTESGLIEDGRSYDIVAYPNPTSGEVNLHYYLPSLSIVDIEIYDPQGKMVKQIVKDLLQRSGSQLITFNVGNGEMRGYLIIVVRVKEFSTQKERILRRGVVLGSN